MGELQFTEVEEELMSSELDAAEPAMQLEENSEDEHERHMLMQQLQQNRHIKNQR